MNRSGYTISKNSSNQQQNKMGNKFCNNDGSRISPLDSGDGDRVPSLDRGGDDDRCGGGGGSSKGKVEEKDMYEKYLPQCAICFSKITGKCISLYCNHHFHIECSQRWLKEKKTCPCCRASAERLPNGYGHGYQIAYFNHMREEGKPTVSFALPKTPDHFKNNVEECVKLSEAITEAGRSLNSIKLSMRAILRVNEIKKLKTVENCEYYTTLQQVEKLETMILKQMHDRLFELMYEEK